MSNPSATDRRSFLKTGALAAAPLAAMAPAAALAAPAAADASGARLARLENECAIEQLQRAFLRRFNGAPEADCSAFLARADAVSLEPGVCAITEDPSSDASLAIDGPRATYERSCRVEIEQDLAGETTVERMTRLQGHTSHRRTEQRVLKSELARSQDGAWVITRLRLA